MAVSEKRVTLDGVEYTFSTLSTSAGLPIYSRLVKALGPMVRKVMLDAEMRKLLEKARSGKDEASVEAAGRELGIKMIALLMEAVENLPTDFLLELASTFAGVSKYKSKEAGGVWLELGEQAVFDQHFATRYYHLTRLIVQHVQANFTDFLANLAASVARAQAESASTSPTA